MKPDRHFVAAAGVLITAACLIVLTWVGTIHAIYSQRLENSNRVTAILGNEALTLSEQINRQILGLDQTLRILVTAWQANPGGFDLEAWRKQAVVLSGLSRDMVLTDENGMIRQSSVNEAINQNAAGLDYFRFLAEQSDHDALYIGPSAIDGIMRQWHMNVARPLHYPDGSFAGVIDTDYRIAAITDVFSQTDLGAGSFVALVGLEDGKLRGAVGPATVDPDANIGETPMFLAIQNAETGIWIGPSASDAVRRIHAFRHVPGRSLSVVVAMNEDEALRPAEVWRRQAQVFAGCITALLVVLAATLTQGTRMARRRAAVLVEDRAVLAASNAQFEVARALAAAKAEQLEATLAGMSDGVSMIDGHMCLVEWNARFPEVAGVPADILRVGLPMEEILRAQIRLGQFGWVQDTEAEIDRRMERLRVSPVGVVQRQRPDGHTLELRRNRLPDGGFVTRYADITEQKKAENALRVARTTAETATAEKTRFIAVISREVAPALDVLVKSIRSISDSTHPASDRSGLATACRSVETLCHLTNDILDMARLDAGDLLLRPSLFELRPLLDSCLTQLSGDSAERGILLRMSIADGTPDTLFADPHRLRQVQLDILAGAIKSARPGTVWLLAEPGRDPREAVRITVRDAGPVPAAARELLVQPTSHVDTGKHREAAEGLLGLSVCRRLVTLMGGDIGCETFVSADELEGSAFWLTLPATALPFRAPRADASEDSPNASGQTTPVISALGRRPPRTRILLIEEGPASQLVTAALLRREGHLVDVAGSGDGAIEGMKRAPYDLVLMDSVMSGRSSQDTASLLRGLPEPAKSTPIILLAANVLPDDDVWLKRGDIDGVLEKPVSLHELPDVLKLRIWQRIRDHEVPLVAPGVAVRPGAVSVLSEDRINELRENLPFNVFAQLVEECLVDVDHRLPALRRALAAGAPAAVTAHAHAMVGMAASYGMAALEARLRTIMNAARQGELQNLDADTADGLRSDFEQAAVCLRQMLQTEAGEHSAR